MALLGDAGSRGEQRVDNPGRHRLPKPALEAELPGRIGLL